MHDEQHGRRMLRASLMEKQSRRLWLYDLKSRLKNIARSLVTEVEVFILWLHVIQIAKNIDAGFASPGLPKMQY